MAEARVPTLNHLLDRTAALDPDRPLVLTSDGRRFTAAGIATAVRATARGFADLGVGRGGVVVSWLPNVPEWYVVHLAAAHLGAVTIPLNTRFRQAELADILRRVPAEVVAVPHGFLNLDLVGIASEVLADLAHAPRLVVVDLDGTANPPSGAITLSDLQRGGEVPISAESDDLVVAFTTSGTTGAPKLAAHDHGAVVRHSLNVAHHVGMDTSAVLLGALPLCGAFGYAGATAALAGGAMIVLQDVFDSDDAAAAFERYSVTHCYGSEALLRGVLDGADRGGKDLSSWKFVAFANFSADGEAVAATIEERLGLRPRGLYGASELFAFMAMRPADAPFEVRVKAGGVPLDDGIALRITSDGETVLGPGETGELQVRGFNVMRGYLGDPEATAAAFTADGWYRSGDLAELATDGSITFLNRMTDTLRLGGYLVDPREVEEHLTAHPAVRRAQVVGVTLPGTGDIAVAFVEPASERRPTRDDLRTFCRQRVAAFKVPSEILFVDTFPVTSGPNGDKIQRSRLREMAATHLKERNDEVVR